MKQNVYCILTLIMTTVFILILGSLFTITVSLFLVITIFLIITLMLVFAKSKTPNSHDLLVKKLFKILNVFYILCLIAIITIRNYIYPSPDIFKNTAYHVFEHKGYQFENNICLVDSVNPQQAIWDDKKGLVDIHLSENDSKIKLKDFFEPLYVEEYFSSNFFDFWDRLVVWLSSYPFMFYVEEYSSSDVFVLQNYNSKENFISELDTLIIALPKRSIKLKFDMNAPDSNYYSVAYSDTSVFNNIKFKVKLAIGYPLIDLLRKADTYPLTNFEESILEGSLIIREKIYYRGGGIPRNSKLVFFPGLNYFKSNCMKIRSTNSTISNSNYLSNYEIKLPNKNYFYTGLGYNKTPVMRIVKDSTDCCQLLFRMPERISLLQDTLLNSQINHFITSSYNEVTESNLEGGIFLPYFSEEHNRNHISSSLSYIIGTSKDSLSFRILDEYKIYEVSKKFERKEYLYTANKDILLNTNSKKNNLKWIICFNDLRSTAPVKLNHLDLYILIYLVWICLILILYYKKNSVPSIITVIIYLIFFSFMIVKLILLWRMGTFVPITNVTYYSYNSLRDSSYYHIILVSTIFFLSLSIAPLYIKSLEKINKKTGAFIYPIFCKIKKMWFFFLRKFVFEKNAKILNVTNFSKNNSQNWMPLFIVIACIIIISLSFKWDRFINIYVPVVLYYYIDFLIVSSGRQYIIVERGKKILTSINIQRFTLWILCVMYLFSSDAGFSIIFVIFSLAWLISGFYKSEKYQFSIWLTSIFVIIVVSAYWGRDLIGNVFIYLGKMPYSHQFILCIPIIIILYLIYSNKKKIDLYCEKASNIVKWRWMKKFLCKATVILCCGVLISTICFFLLYDISEAAKEMANKDLLYAKYRALVHSKSVDELMIANEFKSLDNDKILQAAQNQWFINLYYNSPDNYFEIKPHFDQGASYHAQITDLVLLRYIISEHSEFVVYLFVILWMVLLFALNVFSFNTKSQNIRSFLERFIFMIIIISIFVWLTSTNKFIFFGQDFPLMSLNSKFTMIFTSTFLLLIIAFSPLDIEIKRNLHKFSIQFKNNMIALILFICTFSILFWGTLESGNNKDAYSRKNSSNFEKFFNITEVMNETNAEIYLLNHEFLKFQSDNLPQQRYKGLSEEEKFNKLLNEFEEYFSQSKIEKILKKRFSRSIYKIFWKLNNKRNPREILHINSKDKKYHFALNDKYYLIKSWLSDESKWQGRLFASEVESKSSLMNLDDSRYSPNIQNKTLARDLLLTDASLNRICRGKILNLELSHFPKGWFKDEDEVFILCTTKGYDRSTRGKFSIVNENHFEASYLQDFNLPVMPFKLKHNDVLTIYSLEHRGYFYKYEPLLRMKAIKESERILAQSYWLNGFKRLYFPLGKEFYWSYNFGKLIDEGWGKNILKDGEVLHNPNRKKNLRISIDYDLTKSIYNYIDSLASSEDFKFNICAIDNYGRIRLLFDYKSSVNTPDPNNYDELNTRRRELYIQSTTTEERESYGNLNLLRMGRGVGSSIKPIIYSAVTSQFNLLWNSLHVAGVDVNVLNNISDGEYDNGWKIKYYGGQKFEGASSWTMEVNPANNINYLVNSSNLYNSLIMFIGSYSPPEDIDGFVDKIFVPYNTVEVEAKFPKIFYNQRPLVFNPNNWPSRLGRSPYFGDENSMISRGLHLNYDIATRDEHTQNIRSNTHSNISAKDSDDLYADSISVAHFNWSFPEISRFLQVEREVHPNLVNGLRQPTVGGSPLEITPLKMTEMAVRLFTMNRTGDFHATLSDTISQLTYQGFDSHISWSGGYFRFCKDYIFKSMKDVIGRGTATGLQNFSDDFDKYYFYAKTGTSNIQGSSMFDRHLLLVISNHDFHSTNVSIEDIRNARLFSIFLTFYNVKALPWNKLIPVLEEIVNSKSFNKLME